MIFHNILLDLVSDFGKGPKVCLQNNFWIYFLPREDLIGSTKILFKHLKFCMVWKIMDE